VGEAGVVDGAQGNVEGFEQMEGLEALAGDFGLAEGEFAEVIEAADGKETVVGEADAVEEVVAEGDALEGAEAGEVAEFLAEVLAPVGVAIPEGAGKAELAEVGEAGEAGEVFGDGVDGDPVEESEGEVGGGEFGDIGEGPGGAVEADAAALEEGPFGDGAVSGAGEERGNGGEQNERDSLCAPHGQTISVIL
jgi:hypothetical protein